jgi:hypothetical protein
MMGSVIDGKDILQEALLKAFPALSWRGLKTDSHGLALAPGVGLGFGDAIANVPRRSVGVQALLSAK